VSNPRILTVPENFKTPLNLTLTNAYQTKIPFVSIFDIFYPMLTSTFLCRQLSVYPTSHITPIPLSALVISPFSCYHIDILYQLPDATDLTPKQTFCISTLQKVITILLTKINLSNRYSASFYCRYANCCLQHYIKQQRSN